jgi:arylformamidase
MKIIDISPTISKDLAVWPNDTPFKRSVILDTNTGNNITLSSIETTLHLGAHTDAPNHYAKNALDIAEQPLDYYIGLCQVISVSIGRGERVTPKHITKEIKATRVLFNTNTFPNPNEWNSDFAALSAELIDHLAGLGVILVGLDTPSIDLQDDQLLESHTAVFKHRLAILEGIVLKDVPDGLYELISLPLKIANADASPVRAILRTLNEI